MHVQKLAKLLKLPDFKPMDQYDKECFMGNEDPDAWITYGNTEGDSRVAIVSQNGDLYLDLLDFDQVEENFFYCNVGENVQGMDV